MTGRPHLPQSRPHSRHVQPPQSDCRRLVGHRRGRSKTVPQRGQGGLTDDSRPPSHDGHRFGGNMQSRRRQGPSGVVRHPQSGHVNGWAQRSGRRTGRTKPSISHTVRRTSWATTQKTRPVIPPAKPHKNAPSNADPIPPWMSPANVPAATPQTPKPTDQARGWSMCSRK